MLVHKVQPIHALKAIRKEVGKDNFKPTVKELLRTPGNSIETSRGVVSFGRHSGAWWVSR